MDIFESLSIDTFMESLPLPFKIHLKRKVFSLNSDRYAVRINKNKIPKAVHESNRNIEIVSQKKV